MSSLADIARMKQSERDVNDLREAVRLLTERVEALEAKRAPGRPRLSDAGHREASSGN
jgi:hypothetical protein